MSDITLREHLSRIAKKRWEQMTAEQRSAAGQHRVNARWSKKRKPRLTIPKKSL